MTPEELRERLKRIGLGNTILAGRELGVSTAMVADWLKGKRKVPPLVAEYLRTRGSFRVVRKPGKNEKETT